MKTVLALAALVASQQAAQPLALDQLFYEGFLEQDGVPLNDEVTLTFALYAEESGGTALFSETVSVVVEDGFFAVPVGSVDGIDPVTVMAVAPFLEVSVGIVTLGRARLLAVPYAMHAADAQRAGAVDWNDITNKPGGFADDIDNVGIDEQTLSFGNIAGVASDAQLPPEIARDAELAAALDALAFTSIDGVAADAQLPDVLARDAEVAALLDALSFAELDGVAADAQLPDVIARDAEVAALFDALSFGDIDGVAADAQIPASIARGADVSAELATALDALTFADIDGALTNPFVFGTIDMQPAGATAPQLAMRNTAAPAANRNWRLTNIGTAVTLDALDDAFAGPLTALRAARSGNDVVDVAFPESGITVAGNVTQAVAAGTELLQTLRQGGVNRFAWATAGDGSKLELRRHNDAGQFNDVSIAVTRSNGQVAIGSFNSSELLVTTNGVNVGRVRHNVPSGHFTSYEHQQAGVPRFQTVVDGTGATWSVQRFDDAGAIVDSPIVVNRGSALVALGNANGSWSFIPTSGNPTLRHDVPANAFATYEYQQGGVRRFQTFVNNNGDSWNIGRFDDAGTFANAFSITRSTGTINLNGGARAVNPAGGGDPITHANSTARLSVGGAWQDASSRALKRDIAPLDSDNALDALLDLEPVTFRYKAEPDEEYVGFIAEDVPELVASRGRRNLHAMDLVAVLVRVVQDHDAAVGALDARIETQAAHIDAQAVRIATQAAQIDAQAARIDAQQRELAELKAAVRALSRGPR